MKENQRSLARGQVDIESSVENTVAEYVVNFFRHYEHPLTIYNHTSLVVYNSDRKDRQDREAALIDYLMYPPMYPEQVHWGRTMLAEKAWEINLIEALRPQMIKKNWILKPAPTQLDHSVYSDPFIYQKGSDYLLVEMPRDYQDHGRPKLGIDLTIGGRDCLEYKRKRVGLRWDGFPVIVLPVRNFRYKVFDNSRSNHYRLADFNEYCDQVLVPAIWAGDDLKPFIGLDGEDVWHWKKELGKQLQEGIECCENGLKNCRDDLIRNYLYLKDIYKLLNESADFVKEYRRSLYN